jgi:hypothetical protein
MADRRYLVGERVLVSRAEDGDNHEEATVVDHNERLIYDDSIPSIDGDGERKYLTAGGPNVLELPAEDEDEDADADLDWDDEDDDEPAEADDDEVFGGGPGEETLDED